jgi:hypothetical protein
LAWGLVVLAVGAVARAGEPRDAIAIAVLRDTFVPRVLVQQGDGLWLVNADPQREEGHDLRSLWSGPDDLPLFTTGPDLVRFGTMGEVRGVRLLQPGTYPFYCNEHGFGMQGQLIVV